MPNDNTPFLYSSGSSPNSFLTYSPSPLLPPFVKSTRLLFSSSPGSPVKRLSYIENGHKFTSAVP